MWRPSTLLSNFNRLGAKCAAIRNTTHNQQLDNDVHYIDNIICSSVYESGFVFTQLQGFNSLIITVCPATRE